MKKDKIQFSYEAYIAAPVEKVWKALVDGDLTKQYVYGTRFEGKLVKGAPFAFLGDGDFKVIDGKILDVSPEKALSMTWTANYDEASAKDRASRVTYELTATTPMATKLRVVHDDFDDETATYRGSVERWPLSVSGPKTLVETGKPLVTGGP